MYGRVITHLLRSLAAYPRPYRSHLGPLGIFAKQMWRAALCNRPCQLAP